MSGGERAGYGPVMAATADVDPPAVLGAGTAVWHLAQIREYARLGCDGMVPDWALVAGVPGVG